MGRVYAAPFNISAFGTAAGDILSLETSSTVPVSVHSIVIGQQDSETNEMLGLLLSRQATNGSGGAVAAGEPLNAGDAADGTTIRAGDSTDASGATIELFRDTFSVLSGWQYLPAPEDRIIVPVSDVLTLAVLDVPVVDMNLQGVITYEELS